jgi:hypothetical protein
VLPNPSVAHFTLKVQSADAKPVDVRILDNQGRLVETRSNLAANSTLVLGSQYRPGVYYVEVVQGAEKVQSKLVKMSQ